MLNYNRTVLQTVMPGRVRNYLFSSLPLLIRSFVVILVVILVPLLPSFLLVTAEGQVTRNSPAETKLTHVSAKVRVLVLPLSSTSPKPSGWNMPHEAFKRETIAGISRILLGTGIYEIVPDAEVTAAGGREDIPEWQWLRDDLALVKRVGKAAQADFAIVIIRESVFGQNYRSQIICLNLWTGRKITDSYMIAGRVSKEAFLEENRKAFRQYYRKMFREVKEDLLKISLRKGESMATKPSPFVSSVPDDDREKGFSLSDREAHAPGKTKVVVYDFASEQKLSVAALILAESLREELIKLGNFVLVNREDMGKFLEEMRIQHSGIIDGNQAVSLGKGLAAAEAITGKLHTLGNTRILQVKRTDIETTRTVSSGSIKCLAGHEEELLAEIPGLARKLAGLE